MDFLIVLYEKKTPTNKIRAYIEKIAGESGPIEIKSDLVTKLVHRAYTENHKIDDAALMLKTITNSFKIKNTIKVKDKLTTVFGPTDAAAIMKLAGMNATEKKYKNGTTQQYPVEMERSNQDFDDIHEIASAVHSTDTSIPVDSKIESVIELADDFTATKIDSVETEYVDATKEIQHANGILRRKWYGENMFHYASDFYNVDEKQIQLAVSTDDVDTIQKNVNDMIEDDAPQRPSVLFDTNKPVLLQLQKNTLPANKLPSLLNNEAIKAYLENKRFGAINEDPRVKSVVFNDTSIRILNQKFFEITGVDVLQIIDSLQDPDTF